MLKQAYHEGFPTFSSLKPYYERLDWFIAIPHANLSLLFLPNQITYWLIPGGKALSFQGFYYNALLIGSLTWFLLNLGVKPRLGFAVAIVILFSQFYQMWWTSNFPALGASILPFAVFTSSIRPAWKYLLLFWSLAHMIFGQMYPPFYVSLAVALVPFTLATRPDLLTLRNLGVAAAACVAALAAYLAVNWDYVQLVSATTYPGHRISTGGTSSARALVDLLLPTFPLGRLHDNDRDLYELNMAATFLPLMLLAILPWVQWDRRAIRVTIVSFLTGSVLVYYMLIGFPEVLAKVTGFYLVPARRMHLGLSLLISCYAAFMLSNNWCKFRVWPLLIVAALYAGASYVAGVDTSLQDNFFGVSLYGYALAAFVLVGLLVAAIPLFRWRAASVVAASMMVGMTFVHVIVFGSFNPVMSADDILRPVDTQVTRDWKALYEKNSYKSFGILGNYGHTLRGEGLAALEAVHLANVKPYRYSAIFPSLTFAQINALFNGFRGVGFANLPGQAPEDTQAATLFFPLEPHGVTFAHTTVVSGPGPSLSGGVSKKAYKLGAGSFGVYWESALTLPLAISAPLVLSLNCPVKGSWLTRYPVTIVGAPLVDVALQGVAGEVVVSAVSEVQALKCVSMLKVSLPADMETVALSEAQAPRGAASERNGSIPQKVGGATPMAALISARAEGACSIDTVDGIYSKASFDLRKGQQSHVFRGWLVDYRHRPAGEFSIILKGKRTFRIVARTGMARPDVVAYFHDDVAFGAGFNVASSLALIPKGTYGISLLAKRGGDAYVCEAAKSLTIQ